MYLLAGQSNMDGYGVYTGLPPSLRLGQDDVPMYWSGWGEFRPAAPASYGGSPYTGPEVSFGRRIADAGRPVALVKHAVGGTDLAAYWKPGADAADPDVGPGWATFVTSMRAAEQALDASGEPWRWAGFAWMQGESDALVDTYAAAYADNLAHLVARVREETGVADLPVAIGLIACEGLCPYLDTVRAAEIAVADADPAVVTVETLDLPRNPYDTWHYDGPSTRVLGERLADALLGETSGPPPAAAVSLTRYATRYDGEFTVGWRFTTDRAITVTDVGGFGPGAVLGTPADLGIWDATTAGLLLREVVPSWIEGPTSYRDGYWYTAIDPLPLPPGDYVLGLTSWNGDTDRYPDDAAGTFGDGITFVEGRYATGYWLSYPTTVVPGPALNFMGPNFLYTEG